MANNQIIETVKKMCAEGKHIFSVRKDKRPATPHGFKDATNNPDEFLKFYKEGYGIGLATGKINDTYVLDFDVEKDENNKPIIKDGKPINTGEVNFIDKFVNEENGNQYKTRIIKTQSGGKQLYFKLGEGQEPLRDSLQKYQSYIESVENERKSETVIEYALSIPAMLLNSPSFVACIKVPFGCFPTYNCLLLHRVPYHFRCGRYWIIY